MNLPTFCIKRPVFATVLSLILIVFGLSSYQQLHTQFFPKFIHDSIEVNTFYPGASARLVENTITTPLEKAISGIDGIETISSTSAQGSSAIKIKVTPDTNLYDITNKIRNQVALSSDSMPSNIRTPTVQMGRADMDLMDIGFSIDNDNLPALRDYLDRYVINRISQLPGISNVQVLGANRYAMNIILNPEKMLGRHITTDQVKTSIENSNLQLPAGSIKTPSMEIPVTAETGLHTVDQFNNIVISNTAGKLVTLKDIATVHLGNDTNTKSIVRVNGHQAILLSIFNATDANPIEASESVKTLLAEIKKQLPPTMHAAVTFDQGDYMKASINEVYKTIAIATAFVALIIFFTLGTLRSTLIPIITIPICLLATLGFMYLLGFSINLITLLAIVLSIGLVVDDAIVVLENISRHIENGMSRLQAAIQGSQEIATPVIAMTLTLAAVYAPIGLIKGSVSQIFASFAFTLAAAVIVSGFVALTLSPMMCAKILTHQQANPSRIFHSINQIYAVITSAYQRGLSWILNHRFMVMGFTVFLVVAGFITLSTLPKTFMPKEDMGFLVTVLNTTNGTNNDYAETKLNNLNDIIRTHPDVETNVTISANGGNDSDGNNMIFSTLKPFAERQYSADQLAFQVNQQIRKQPGLDADTFAPSFGGSAHEEIAFYIMAPVNYTTLFKTANDLIAKLKNYGRLRNVASNMQFNSQQYELTVDRSLAASLQVPIRNIDETLANLLGGSTVSTFDLNGQTYDVTMQASDAYLSSVDAIKSFEVATNNNQFVPLGDLIHIKSVLAQPTLFHYNRLRAAEITADLATNTKLATAVTDLEKMLPEWLPNTTKYAFTGQAERIVQSKNSMGTIFLLAIVFIYLVLSAQFESFLDPLIILLAVPLSIVGAVIGLKAVDGSINIYTVIGLVTLVGLVAKHGILITQFANALQQAGKDAKTAVLEAASIRLRPILMTTAAMVFGALSLIFATGASANSRMEIGTVIVAGLLLGTFFSLALVPIAYTYMAQFKKFLNRVPHRQ